MGLYLINCQICNLPYLWFSGLPHQICSECIEKDPKIKEWVQKQQKPKERTTSIATNTGSIVECLSKEQK
jgi:hypothetical protein